MTCKMLVMLKNKKRILHGSTSILFMRFVRLSKSKIFIKFKTKKKKDVRLI